MSTIIVTSGAGFIGGNFIHYYLNEQSDTAEFVYKCTDVYALASKDGIPWNEESIGIDWAGLDADYITSERDNTLPSFKDQSFEWAEGRL